eukprot:6754226-Pyramimonas_sp.AAC.1
MMTSRQLERSIGNFTFIALKRNGELISILRPWYDFPRGGYGAPGPFPEKRFCRAPLGSGAADFFLRGTWVRNGLQKSWPTVRVRLGLLQ